MAKKVTMQKIADKIGVTKVSVSKAINNQQGISDNLREQILAIAKQMGYTKLKNEEEKKNYSFAVVSPKRFFLEDETFYTTIYYYLNKRCMEKNYTVSCFVINDKEEISGLIPSQLLTSNFDGIFIAGEFKRDYLKKIESLNGTKIAIDFYMLGITMDSVVIDNYDTGLEVTSYLIQRGHKKIGFVGNIKHTSSICDRYFGYSKAMKINNIPINEEWHISNNDTHTGVYTLDFQLPEDMPTAFVCHCDKAAFTLMQKLELCGIKVPDDVSVISFDNTSICDLVTPKLTSVDIDRKQIAIYSLEQMIYRLNHPHSLPKKIYLGSKLIERESVKDIN